MLSNLMDVPIFNEYRPPPGQYDLETCEDEFLNANSALAHGKLAEVRELISRAISIDTVLFTLR